MSDLTQNLIQRMEALGVSTEPTRLQEDLLSVLQGLERLQQQMRRSRLYSDSRCVLCRCRCSSFSVAGASECGNGHDVDVIHRWEGVIDSNWVRDSCLAGDWEKTTLRELHEDFVNEMDPSDKKKPRSRKAMVELIEATLNKIGPRL